MRYAHGASSGTIAAGTGFSGTNVTQLNSPINVYFDSANQSLLITNYAISNVVRWPLGGTQWSLVAGDPLGVPGTSAKQLSTPIGITMDPMGNLYVTDFANSRIQLFLTGQFEGITIAGTTGVTGSNTSLLTYPYSVELDNQLNLYVADTNNHRIVKFLLKNNFTLKHVAGVSGSLGNSQDKLSYPAGVFVSKTDRAVYVADRGNNRIQKWSFNSSVGITIAGNSNGISGSDMYSLNAPYAVILDSTETYMYVADYSNNRVQKFLLP